MQITPKEFYQQHPSVVAAGLVGNFLVIKKDDGTKTLALISDAEAYGGLDDPGSYYNHQKGSRMATETGLLWTKNHRGDGKFMVNVIVHEEGKAGAALIRAVRIMKTPIQNLEKIDGPIRWSTQLGIDESYDKIDLTVQSNKMFICDLGLKNFKVLRTKRVRVTNDDGRLWRFVLIHDKTFFQDDKESKRERDKWLFEVRNGVWKFPGLTREEYQILMNSNPQTMDRTLKRLETVGEISRESSTNGQGRLVYRWYPQGFEVE